MIIYSDVFLNDCGTLFTIKAKPLKVGVSNLTLSHIVVARMINTSPGVIADSYIVNNGTITITTSQYDINDDGLINMLDLDMIFQHMGEYDLNAKYEVDKKDAS